MSKGRGISPSNLGRQVDAALKSITRLGKSKYLAKDEYRVELAARGAKYSTAKTNYIHSHKWLKNVREVSMRYLLFSKEKGYHHKNINQFQHEKAGSAFFEDLISRGVKDIEGTAAALRKFAEAINNKFGGDVAIVPDDIRGMVNKANSQVGTPAIPILKRDKLVSRRGFRIYTPEEMGMIMKNVWSQKEGARYGAAIRGMSELGLRAKECFKLRVKDINFERGLLHVVDGSKGGRKRVVPISKPYLAELKSICRNKSGASYVYETPGFKWENRAKNTWTALRKACLKSGIKQHRLHNLRATYAFSKYKEYIEDGGMDEQSAKLAVSKLLGHNRVDVVAWYLGNLSETNPL